MSFAWWWSAIYKCFLLSICTETFLCMNTSIHWSIYWMIYQHFNTFSSLCLSFQISQKLIKKPLVLEAPFRILNSSFNKVLASYLLSDSCAWITASFPTSYNEDNIDHFLRQNISVRYFLQWYIFTKTHLHEIM